MATNRTEATAYSDAPMTHCGVTGESVTDVIERAVATGRCDAGPSYTRRRRSCCVVVLALAALVGFLGCDLVDGRHRPRRATTPAPVLVATQDVFASIAEADAASSAVFLSGTDEDREQRRLYEVAHRTRPPRQLEEVSPSRR